MAENLKQEDLNQEMIEIGVGRYRNSFETTKNINFLNSMGN